MSLFNIAKAAGMAALMCSASANAAIILSATPGNAVYSGPTPTYDFESATPEFTGGSIVTGTTPIHTTPLGSTGSYGSVSPSNGTPGFLDLPGGVNGISFIWGSVDRENILSVLDSSDNVIFSADGSDVLALLGAPTPGLRFDVDPVLNPLVTITFTDADVGTAARLRFESTKEAFEFDNVAAVPEPATWAFMILGFGAIGGAMRRQRKANVKVSYA